jgi:hypothetical protein
MSSNNIPTNRTMLMNRYRISRKTLYKWFIRYEIYTKVPDIDKRKTFTLKEGQMFVEMWG